MDFQSDDAYERWVSFTAAQERGETLTLEQSRFVSDYELALEPTEHEKQIWSGLGTIGEEPGADDQLVSDEELIAAALEHIPSSPLARLHNIDPQASAAPSTLPLARGSSSPTSRVAWGVGGFALAAMTVMAIVQLNWLPGLSGTITGHSNTSSMAPHIAENDYAMQTAMERKSARRPQTVGSQTGAPQTIDSNEQALDLEVVEPEMFEPEEIEASEKLKRVQRPRKSENDLLRDAQKWFTQGDTQAASKAYRQLIRHYPKSDEAWAGRVSLGKLELGQGQASVALKLFRAYVKRGEGGLLEQAQLGEIKCLRQLGQADNELDALEAFIASNPTSIQIRKLQPRLEQLRDRR